MKYLLVFLSAFISANFCSQEFSKSKEGFIYSADAMEKLTKIVDSLNLKYKTCDFNQNYFSQKQTFGYILDVDESEISSALKDIEKNITISEFISKYPKTKVLENELFLKRNYVDYRDKKILRFHSIDFNGDDGYEIEFDYSKKKDEKDYTNSWVFDYGKKTSYSPESLVAFYFPKDFESTKIPQEYVNKIVYSDCLISTSQTKFLNEDSSGERYDPEMFEYLNLEGKDLEKFSKSGKETMLTNLRKRPIIGGCSRDSSPRVQSLLIAELSAETYNWEVFLRAHLDLLNDNFERVSDGSYAQKNRRTYLAELENLNIDVPRLLIGSSIRMENTPKNHYYNNIYRLGRAISESKNKLDFEKEILTAVRDENLDFYNKTLMVLLYRSYLYHYEGSTTAKKFAKADLLKAIGTLPKEIQAKIEIKEF